MAKDAFRGRNLWLFLAGAVALYVVGLLLPDRLEPLRPYLTIIAIAPWAISVMKVQGYVVLAVVLAALTFGIHWIRS